MLLLLISYFSDCDYIIVILLNITIFVKLMLRCEMAARQKDAYILFRTS